MDKNIDNYSTLSVRAIVGSPFCVSTEDGILVFQAIRQVLQQEQGQGVVLSFAGVDSLTSAFLNAAIGQLYSVFSETQIQGALSVDHMERSDKILLRKVVENAKRYAQDPQSYSDALERAMEAA